MKFTKRKARVWCEDISPTIKIIKASKNHKKLININGIDYERIGDDLLYNLKSSLIEKFV